MILALARTLRIRFFDHLLAEIDANQIVLEDIVVEHVFGGFAEIDDPFRDIRRPDSERHILRIGGARGMVIAADAADAAGDKVSVARVFPFHENAVPTKDGGRAMALGNLLARQNRSW